MYSLTSAFWEDAPTMQINERGFNQRYSQGVDRDFLWKFEGKEHISDYYHPKN